MASRKQIIANRQNATRSTGPLTIAGKAAVAKNAISHGLSSAGILLPTEDPEEFEQFRNGIRAQLNPLGELESALADRIVGLIWKLQRSGKIEAGIMAWQYYEILQQRAEAQAETFTKKDPSAVDAEFNVFKGKVEVIDEQQHRSALMEKDRLVAAQAEASTWGLAFIRASVGKDALGKLSRYESSIQRNLFKVMHELERCQARRNGQLVPPPAVVDIDVSGVESNGITTD